MRKIKINCKRIYNTGVLYSTESNEISQIKRNLSEISERIKKLWTGTDNHNFIESFDAHIYDLTNLINYLDGNGKIMNDTALNHNQINVNFYKKIERSEKDEYRG